MRGAPFVSGRFGIGCVPPALLAVSGVEPLDRVAWSRMGRSHDERRDVVADARQIGNAVPPRLAAAVAGTVVEALGFTPVKPRRRVGLGPDRLLRFSLTTAADHFDYDRAKLTVDVRRTANRHDGTDE